MELSLEDRAELHDLYSRYAHLQDAGRIDEWIELFAADGRLAPPGIEPVVGHAALRAAAGRWSAWPGMRHLLMNVLVEPDGDGAAGRAYFLAFRVGGDGELRMRNIGRYEDRFVRADGGWRFASREVVGELPVALVDAPLVFAATGAT